MTERRKKMLMPREFLLEVSVLVDPDQVDTPEKEKEWKRKVEKMLGDLIELGIFNVENWL